MPRGSLRRPRTPGRALWVALAPLAATVCTSVQGADSMLTWNAEGLYHLYHAYSASDGRTYVEEIAVPQTKSSSAFSKAATIFDLMQPQSVRIAHSADGEMIDWHYATDYRHLIIPLQGDLVFDTGDGNLYHVKAGEAILAEDWTGKGHRSGCAATNGKFCLAIDIQVAPNPKTVPLRAPPAVNGPPR
jgi:quercetin dioxygenase-like cupin family protein